MADKEKAQWLVDACGYMVFCLDNDISATEQLYNLQHDILGMVRNEICFSPRLHGYAKHWCAYSWAYISLL